MDAIEALHSRNSAPRLTGVVSDDAIEVILRAGLRAPDHGQLRPWRILIVKGDAREKLGELFVSAKLADEPEQSEEQLVKLRAKPMRAPLIFVVAAVLTEHPKVPEIEQMLSAGAVAQNMLIAAHSLGLGAMWRTGGMAYHPMVHAGLGFAQHEKIIGFLYVGEIDGRVKSLSTMDLDAFVETWSGSH